MHANRSALMRIAMLLPVAFTVALISGECLIFVRHFLCYYWPQHPIYSAAVSAIYFPVLSLIFWSLAACAIIDPGTVDPIKAFRLRIMPKL